MKLYKLLSQLKNPRNLLSILLQFSIVLLSVAYPLFYPSKVQATLSVSYLRLDRQSENAQLGGVVCEKSSLTSGGVAKVIVSFPSTFNLSGTSFTVDTDTVNLPFNSTVWPSIQGPTEIDDATKAAVFTSDDLTDSNATYCFHFTTTGSNYNVGAAGADETGAIITYTSSGDVVENGFYATAITSGTNSEQVQVTASVSATFSFALSGGDASHNLPLGVLNSATPVTSPYTVTATVSTNAHNGFLSWVKGTNVDGLHSPTAGGTGITSPSTYPTVTDLASNNGYGIFATTGANTPDIAPGYVSDNGTKVGHIDSAQFNLVASLTGQQSGTTFTIGARAKPDATQLAATDYSDTLTIIAAGSF